MSKCVGVLGDGARGRAEGRWWWDCKEAVCWRYELRRRFYILYFFILFLLLALYDKLVVARVGAVCVCGPRNVQVREVWELLLLLDEGGKGERGRGTAWWGVEIGRQWWRVSFITRWDSRPVPHGREQPTPPPPLPATVTGPRCKRTTGPACRVTGRGRRWRLFSARDSCQDASVHSYARVVHGCVCVCALSVSSSALRVSGEGSGKAGEGGGMRRRFQKWKIFLVSILDSLPTFCHLPPSLPSSFPLPSLFLISASISGWSGITPSKKKRKTHML